jgi:hypothetical protein
MGIINRVVFVCPGSHFPERFRIENLSASKGGAEHVTVASTAVDASTADAGLRRHIAGTIGGLKSVIGIGPVKIHVLLLSGQIKSTKKVPALETDEHLVLERSQNNFEP